MRSLKHSQYIVLQVLYNNNFVKHRQHCSRILFEKVDNRGSIKQKHGTVRDSLQTEARVQGIESENKARLLRE